jgi:hypothetical protein
MKIHRDIGQQSWEWFTRRAGKVSGSELGNLITDKGKLRDWKTGMPNSYLHRKLAEKWRGGPLETFIGSRQTDQGQLHEEKARNYFAALLEKDIETIGGIESDDGKLWCSPDGIIGETMGLEIKCPNADTQVGWLLGGPQVPEEHVLQVQFALHVTHWPTWRFLSWVKDLPHLAVTVEPDEAIATTIESAVAEFQGRFEEAWTQLCDLNGGPPPPKPAFTPSPGPVKFSWEMSEDDVVTP